MHLQRIELDPCLYLTTEYYPFNLGIFSKNTVLQFKKPVTFFVGENGSGKSTLLQAICRKCGIHIWENRAGSRVMRNPFEQELYRAVRLKWHNGSVPGSFFGSDLFRDFSHIVEEWASTNPEQLQYFGGASLLTQSHGQSLMSYFTSRYTRTGLYFLDEPETALSPATQIALLQLIQKMSKAGHAQFIIASHSPILMACPNATHYSFDYDTIQETDYEKTPHFRLYKEFMTNPERFLEE
jgi:predicted ATPase